MNGLKANTEKIAETARAIEDANTRIGRENEDFSAANRQLYDSWDGEASEPLRVRFSVIQAKRSAACETALLDTAAYLRDAVAAGYDETEKENSRLAERFR